MSTNYFDRNYGEIPRPSYPPEVEVLKLGEVAVTEPEQETSESVES